MCLGDRLSPDGKQVAINGIVMTTSSRVSRKGRSCASSSLEAADGKRVQTA